MPTLDELKDRLAAKLDPWEILDLLQITERELLDFLDEPLEDNKEKLLAALN